MKLIFTHLDEVLVVYPAVSFTRCQYTLVKIHSNFWWLLADYLGFWQDWSSGAETLTGV